MGIPLSSRNWPADSNPNTPQSPLNPSPSSAPQLPVTGDVPPSRGLHSLTAVAPAKGQTPTQLFLFGGAPQHGPMVGASAPSWSMQTFGYRPKAFREQCTLGLCVSHVGRVSWWPWIVVTLDPHQPPRARTRRTTLGALGPCPKACARRESQVACMDNLFWSLFVPRALGAREGIACAAARSIALWSRWASGQTVHD